MPVTSTTTYIDNKDPLVTEQVGPVPYSVGNPPNSWARLLIDHWDANGVYGSATLFLGPASYAAFIVWLGSEPVLFPAPPANPP